MQSFPSSAFNRPFRAVMHRFWPLLLVLGVLLFGVNQFSRADNKPVTTQSGYSAKVSFVVMGDTGSGASMQMQIADRLLSHFKQQPYMGLLLLGDVIYPQWQKSLTHERFTKPYKPLMDSGVPFWIVLGNHDVKGKEIPDQIKFYKMPGRYYVKSLKLGQPNSVDLFIIDSNTFSKEVAQQTWLQGSLKKSQARWKIVAGHHPVYTSGEHAPDADLKLLKRKLEPLLTGAHVDAYLAGHDHDYERMKPVNGVLHIVSGGGGAYLRGFQKVPNVHSLIRHKVHHFLRVEAQPHTLQIQAINKEGQVFDSVALKK
jgi:hypothetical protein